MLAMHRLMVSEGQRFPELAHDMCQTGRDQAAVDLGRWLAAHQARGLLRADMPAPTLAQHYIQLVVDGPQLRALVGELRPGWTSAGIHRHVEQTIELFLNGAGSPPGTALAAPAHPARSRKRQLVSRKTRR
jgi:AefR-like transcriptional repressor, C-terminal domain